MAQEDCLELLLRDIVKSGEKIKGKRLYYGDKSLFTMIITDDYYGSDKIMNDMNEDPSLHNPFIDVKRQLIHEYSLDKIIEKNQIDYIVLLTKIGILHVKAYYDKEPYMGLYPYYTSSIVQKILLFNGSARFTMASYILKTWRHLVSYRRDVIRISNLSELLYCLKKGKKREKMWKGILFYDLSGSFRHIQEHDYEMCVYGLKSEYYENLDLPIQEQIMYGRMENIQLFLRYHQGEMKGLIKVRYINKESLEILLCLLLDKKIGKMDVKSLGIDDEFTNDLLRAFEHFKEYRYIFIKENLFEWEAIKGRLDTVFLLIKIGIFSTEDYIQSFKFLHDKNTKEFIKNNINFLRHENLIYRYDDTEIYKECCVCLKARGVEEGEVMYEPLYPCGHSGYCKACISKIKEKKCPRCRLDIIEM